MEWLHPEDVVRAKILGAQVKCYNCKHYLDEDGRYYRGKWCGQMGRFPSHERVPVCELFELKLNPVQA